MLSRMGQFRPLNAASTLLSLHKMGYKDCFQCINSLHRTGSITPLISCSKPLSAAFLLHKQTRHYSDSKKVTALTVIKDLKHLKSSPTPALVLGLSGVIPFLAPPLYMGMTGSFVASLAYSQVAYGAVILSFVGAVRWGMALSDNEVVRPNWINLGYSVTPSLIAWVALMMPTALSLSTLILGLGGAAYMDITMYGYPAWFKAMRFLLTMTAILSLWTTLIFKYILSESAKEARAKSKKKKVVSEEKVDKEAVVRSVIKEIEPAADVVLTEVKYMGKESKPAVENSEESQKTFEGETNKIVQGTNATSSKNEIEAEDREIQTVLYPRI